MVMNSVFFPLVLLVPGLMVEDDLTNTTVHSLLCVKRVSEIHAEHPLEHAVLLIYGLLNCLASSELTLQNGKQHLLLHISNYLYLQVMVRKSWVL